MEVLLYRYSSGLIIRQTEGSAVRSPSTAVLEITSSGIKHATVRAPKPGISSVSPDRSDVLRFGWWQMAGGMSAYMVPSGTKASADRSLLVQ